VRSNEQMMQSMKGATQLLGSMNRQMNLPALQRIAMEFEKENDIMDQRQEMMDDAIDDVTGLEDEEESEEVVTQVLDEIGIDLGQAVSSLGPLTRLDSLTMCSLERLHKVSRRMPRRTARWRKQSEVRMPVTMISKQGWTVCGDEGNTEHVSPILMSMAIAMLCREYHEKTRCQIRLVLRTSNEHKQVLVLSDRKDVRPVARTLFITPCRLACNIYNAFC
jgi:hypothetical protein